MKKILVNLGLLQRHKEILEAAAPGCEFIYESETPLSPELVQQAEVIVDAKRGRGTL